MDPARRHTRATAAQRVSNACEACRAAKLKCQPGSQEGVCRRCLEGKRECVFRTGPRTRMSKVAKMNNETPPEKPKASQTFNINFSMPPEEDPTSSFEALRQRHEGYIEDYLPLLSFNDPLPDPQQQQPSPAPSSTQRTIQSLGLQPQFNLASATSLLSTFRSMLPYFPCIVLGPEETVGSLAHDRPFVLLAILASASGSRTLQGHGLYDEEFRKVLGLKFVAGGERTLELLQGLLIYCAWYPFHLRPKNKHAYQYIRMAADIVHDLELDRCPSSLNAQEDITLEQIDGIRTYLCCYYLVTAFSAVWSRLSHANLKHTAWTSTCYAALERLSSRKDDLVLSWLVRQAHIVEQAADLARGKKSPSANESQLRLMMLGLESQHREWSSRIPAAITNHPSPAALGNLFAEVFVLTAPLLRVPLNNSKAALGPDFEKVRLAVPTLARFLDVAAGLDHSCFSAVDWVKFIMGVVLGMRLCFPIRDLPAWDFVQAREDLHYGELLDRLCTPAATGEETSPDPPGSSSKALDIAAASRVIIGVVRKKYNDRLQRTTEDATRPTTCPMLDGSLEEYFPLWDASGGGFDIPEVMSGSGTGTGTGSEGEGSQGRQIYHDLWATMTMSWASDSS